MSGPNLSLETVVTGPADSLTWMRWDAMVRLVPFALACLAAWALWRPSWLGFNSGSLEAQLLFGLLSAPVMFCAAAGIARAVALAERRLVVPTGTDAALQAGYYCINAPLEEAFFRGLVQGGLGALTGLPPVGFAVAATAYVFYHRLGGWSWRAVSATALAGVPLGLAFWLLPGPPSLLGVTLSHLGATCGFLGPGPYLMRRLRLLP